jgi:hypothetical protein
MNLSKFDKSTFDQLLSFVEPRCISFHDKGPGIIMRHDVDNDLPRSVKMARAEAAAGISATYFILNTAPYWKDCWASLKEIQSLGHEIAWHNNVITEWIKCDKKKSIDELITDTLFEFMEHGFEIKGSASHGDGLCYQYNYVNYQAFTCYPKNGINGNPAKVDFDQVEMSSYGLEYEAYSVGQDVYLSESGKVWKTPVLAGDLLNKENRVQILIHPQWWTL